MKTKQIYFYDGTSFLVMENKDGELEYPEGNGLILHHQKDFMNLSILMVKNGWVHRTKNGWNNSLKLK